jgi:hypothetical protein
VKSAPTQIHTNCAQTTEALKPKAMNRNLFIIPWVVGVMMAAGPSRAQTTAKPSDAIILVQPSGGDLFVAVTYPTIIDHARVKNHLSQLAKHGGWAAGPVEISDQNIKTSPTFGNVKTVGQQTDATTTFRNAVAAKQGGFILQPFVQAFSDLRRIQLMFFMPKQQGFVGLRDFDSPGLTVHLLRDGGPYLYGIDIKDRAALPVLPHTQPTAAPVASGPPVAAKPRVQAGTSMAFVIVLAAACGLIVLGALIAFSSLRARQEARPRSRTASRPRRT